MEVDFNTHLNSIWHKLKSMRYKLKSFCSKSDLEEISQCKSFHVHIAYDTVPLKSKLPSSRETRLSSRETKVSSRETRLSSLETRLSSLETSREPWKTVSKAAWTSREILVAYNATQQSFPRSDIASLVSAGAWIPMFANLSFIKTEDITPEIFNPFGLKMVSKNIYTTNFSVFNRTYIVDDFHGVQTCSLKLLLLLIDPSGFFRQARASSEHRDLIMKSSTSL